MSLYENINRRKKLGISRPKSKSTISKKAYANMKKGFPKIKLKKKDSTKTRKWKDGKEINPKKRPKDRRLLDLDFRGYNDPQDRGYIKGSSGFKALKKFKKKK